MGEALVKNNKILMYTPGDTIQSLVDYANSHHITKDDLVTIIEKNKTFYLVYYYGGE